MTYLHVMRLMSCAFCENRRREDCTSLVYGRKELHLVYSTPWKIKNAFVLLCALPRYASTPFPVLFRRLFVQRVVLTSGQGAELANGPVGIFILCVNW